MNRQNAFSLVVSMGELSFYDRSWYWLTEEDKYYPHEIEFAKFLFDELIPKTVTIIKTNFLLTDGDNRKRLFLHAKNSEAKLRKILRENEW